MTLNCIWWWGSCSTALGSMIIHSGLVKIVWKISSCPCSGSLFFLTLMLSKDRASESAWTQYVISLLTRLRICWLNLSQKGKTTPTKVGGFGYDTELHLVVRLLFWSSGLPLPPSPMLNMNVRCTHYRNTWWVDMPLKSINLTSRIRIPPDSLTCH